MPLTFHPRPGMVLICDFNTGFKAPEMVKRRPVVVLSLRGRTDGLCTVVPLSTTEPIPIQAFHHRMDPASLPGHFAATETWAKCQMVATVSLARLDRVKVGKDAKGKRLYATEPVTPADLEAIRRCVMVALGVVGP